MTDQFDERLDRASSLSDLLDALLALQPPDYALLGGLAVARWGNDHPDKRRVLANLAAIKAAIV